MVKVRNYNINYSPTVVKAFNEYSRSGLAEIRWLTTWDVKARTHLAPALGFDEFLLARDPEKKETKRVAMDLAERYPHRPIIWIDDEVGYYAQKKMSFWMQRDASTLLLECRNHLNEKHMAMIDKFLKSCSQKRSPFGNDVVFNAVDLSKDQNY